VSVAEVAAIDLVIVGAVAVSADGARLGKGGGWADLEHALLLETGRIGPRTPVVTTVHATGVLDAGEIPMEPHDVPLDGFATADGFTRCRRARRRPEGVLWDRLDAERVAEIPALARFARRTQGGRTRGRGGASRGPSAPRRG
jgi:5-formyltetrahydrofolate cyclo-ligase